MRAAMAWRMARWRSAADPVAAAGAVGRSVVGGWVGAAAWGRGVWVARATSARVTAPSGPLTCRPARSTRSSWARRRAAGEARVGVGRARAGTAASAGGGGGASVGRAGLAAGGVLAVATAAPSTSARVIAPLRPVPWIAWRSTPSWCARRRTTGETGLACRAGGAGSTVGGLVSCGGAGAATTGRGAGARGGSGEATGGGVVSAGERRVARTVPTGTRSPSATRSCSMTPPWKISTSIAALSVSTRATTSPRLTVSPGLTCHSSRVPASMSAPSDGMRNSATARHHAAGRVEDAGHLGKRGVLEMLCVGDGYLGAAHPRDRCVQLPEGAFHDPGADLGGEAATAPALVDHDGPVRARDRCQDGCLVQWAERAQVDHLGLDAVRGQGVGRSEGPHTAQGGADSGTDEGRLRQRRVADALGAELLQQALADPEAPAVAADVLAHQEHAPVALQRLAQRLPECLAVGELDPGPGRGALASRRAAHGVASRYTLRVSSPTGSGVPASANATAWSISAPISASMRARPSLSSAFFSMSRAEKVAIGSRRFHVSTSSLVRYSSGSYMEWARNR